MRIVHVKKVAQKFPGMTDDQRKYLSFIFDPTKTINRTQPVFQAVTITGDSAKMPVEIRVSLIQKATGSSTTVPLRYNAVFARKNGKFSLVALLPR